MPIILLKLLNNKYTWILLFITASIWMLNSYTNGKVEDALTQAKNEVVKVFNDFNKEDEADAIETIKNNGNLSDDELDNSLCGGEDCPYNGLPERVETGQPTSAGLPAYPQIIPQVQTGFEEQQRQPEEIYEQVQCTHSMRSDCQTYPQCCQYF